MTQSSRPLDSDAAIAFDSVTKIFRPQKGLFGGRSGESTGDTVALSSVSLEAFRGEVLVLLGTHASGKTTLLRAASAALLPDSGRVSVEGHNTLTESNVVHRIVAHCTGLNRSFFRR